LNCKINKQTKFDRKNYFYPDLPKGFQISQYDEPIGYDGFVEIDLGDSKKNIGITRVHQEEDTGKSIHQGDTTFLDFNKSGVPLIEIVSEPDFRTVDEVTAYAKLLHQTARYLNISDADMEKGQMRFEINISLRKKGEKELPDYKVEVKNIGSISVLQKVIEKEIERQTELLESGKTPIQETRGLDGMSGDTSSMRTKETADDYRYFPEPDIPPIEFTDDYIESILGSLSEGPQEKSERYVKEYGLDKYTANVIVSDLSKVEMFENAVKDVKDKKVIKEVSKIIIGVNSELSKVFDSQVEPKYLNELASLVVNGEVSNNLEREILEGVFLTGKSPSDIVTEKGLTGSVDEADIKNICKQVISQNPKVVDDVKNNPNAIMFLVGQVMKETKGMADAQKVREIIQDLIK
jgi:aspartyl-tRNA(Asn)/glutamyl-tRNA(Gln) amidotransferase subunit B